MNQKSYIAILFATVLFGKILIMDSTLLLAIFDTHEIAYVNPFCKKKNLKIDESKSIKSIAEDSQKLILTMNSFCNAPFKFEIFEWKSRTILEQSQTYTYNTPAIPEFFQDKFYPPPQPEFLPQHI